MMFIDEQQQLSIYGIDRLFMEGVRYALARPLAAGKRRITVLVYAGMTLPEVLMHHHRAEKDELLVVFCSAACLRMLKGTQAYACALFLPTDLPVRQIQQSVQQWLRSPKPATLLQLRDSDHEVLQAIMGGQLVQKPLVRPQGKSKTHYSRISALAKRMGTHTRQELYLKVFLLNIFSVPGP